MTQKQQALIILTEIDRSAPVNVNWNNTHLWLKSIINGLKIIEDLKDETPGAATPRESGNK